MSWRALWLSLPVFLLAQCAHRPAPLEPPPDFPPISSAAEPVPETRALPAWGDVFAPVWRREGDGERRALVHGAELHRYDAVSENRRVEMALVVFDDRRLTLRVVDQPDANAGAGRVRGIAQELGAAACINGGFFHPDFTPLGLFTADGRSAGRMARTSLVSGAVVVRAGVPTLVWNAEAGGYEGAAQVLQAGPRLVHEGRAVPGLDGVKQAARSFVLHDGGHRWALGTARDCSLAELGEMLATAGLLPELKAWRALNLDGGRSTALCARYAEGGELCRPGWRTVRNYLAVVPH